MWKKIKAAAQRLGIEPTEGMLAKNKDIHILEDTLATSPTITGGRVSKSVEKAKEGLSKAGEEVLKERVPGDPFDLGESLKSAVTSKIGEKLAPLQMNYNELAETYKNVPLSPKSVKASARSRRNLDIAEFPQTESRLNSPQICRHD